MAAAITASSSLIGKYLVVIFGHEGDTRVAECARKLEIALAGLFNDRGVPAKKFLTQIPSGASSPAVDRLMPAVGVFLV
jgi:hypothetical protein